MVRYSHLPIFRGVYELLLEFHKLFPNFPKKYKYVIGSLLINEVYEVLMLIIKINSSMYKKELLEELILKLELIKVNVRVLKDLLVISKNKYFELSEKVITLLKQAEGWKKSSISPGA